MFNYDAFEAVGHNITLVQGMLAGVSTYYCENCGALVQVGGPESKLLLFHVPPGSPSTEEFCVQSGAIRKKAMLPPESLKDKLKKLQDESYERLRRAAEE